MVLGSQIERESLLKALLEANGELAKQVRLDPLTGALNRRALLEALRHQLEAANSRQLTTLVAFIDLDDFKLVNDEFGHAAGDELLMAIAERLRGMIRPHDILARYGGDEFVVSVLGIDAASAAAATALQERLTQITSDSFECQQVTIRCGGGSVGVLVVEPHTLDALSALNLADQLMYRTKAQRKAAQRQAAAPKQEPNKPQADGHNATLRDPDLHKPLSLDANVDKGRDR